MISFCFLLCHLIQKLKFYDSINKNYNEFYVSRLDCNFYICTYFVFICLCPLCKFNGNSSIEEIEIGYSNTAFCDTNLITVLLNLYCFVLFGFPFEITDFLE